MVWKKRCTSGVKHFGKKVVSGGNSLGLVKARTLMLGKDPDSFLRAEKAGGRDEDRRSREERRQDRLRSRITLPKLNW